MGGSSCNYIYSCMKLIPALCKSLPGGKKCLSESAEIVFILNKTTIHDFLLFRNNIDIVIFQTHSMSGGKRKVLLIEKTD